MNNNNNNSTEFVKLNLAGISSEGNKPSGINFKKYFHFLLRKKLLIFTIMVILALIWIVLYSLFYDKFIKYTTSAVIRFDDPTLTRNIGALTDFSAGMETRSKVAILHTNSFLGRVVDSLHLNLIIDSPDLNRTALLKNIRILENAKYGEYTLLYQNDSLVFNYSSETTNEKDRFLYESSDLTGPIVKFRKNGLNLDINKQEIIVKKKIVLKLLPRRYAINLLRDNTDIQLDRSRTILTISYTDKSPNFCAVVTNTISELFIQQLWDYERFQTVSILNSLEDQLEAAKKELEASEKELKEFREKNPLIALRTDSQTLIDNLSQNETTLFNLNGITSELSVIVEREKNTKNSDNRNHIYQELLTFLSNQNQSGASVLLEEYRTTLTARENLLDQNYSITHPSIIEIDEQLKAINSSNYNLRRLPSTELRLAELTRNHQIQESIVSSIMRRYNEAKVTDAAIIPDAYIIDSAEPGMIDKSFRKKLPMYILGVLFAFIVSLGFVLLVGFFDPRLWVTDEVAQKLSLPILATIPVIGRNDELIDFKSINAIDPKLITSDYSPTHAGESFRRLRTVLELDRKDSSNALLIGSLKPNEGKSLVSCNIAVTFAQKKYHTILLDGDIRRGVIHSSFACKKQPGLTDILTTNHGINEKYVSSIKQDTHIPNLNLISSGPPVPNPSELLGTNRMKELIEYLKNKYDMIIIDSPPFSLCPDLFVLNMLIHNITLVIKYQSTNLSDINKYLTEFKESRKDIRGLIINASRELVEGKGSYQYSYYNY